MLYKCCLSGNTASCFILLMESKILSFRSRSVPTSSLTAWAIDFTSCTRSFFVFFRVAIALHNLELCDTALSGGACMHMHSGISPAAAQLHSCSLRLYNTHLKYKMLIAHVNLDYNLSVILPERCYYICTVVQHSYLIYSWSHIHYH